MTKKQLDNDIRQHFSETIHRIAKIRNLTTLHALLYFCKTRSVAPELMTPFMDRTLHAAIVQERKLRGATLPTIDGDLETSIATLFKESKY